MTVVMLIVRFYSERLSSILWITYKQLEAFEHYK